MCYCISSLCNVLRPSDSEFFTVCSLKESFAAASFADNPSSRQNSMALRWVGGRDDRALRTLATNSPYSTADVPQLDKSLLHDFLGNFGILGIGSAICQQTPGIAPIYDIESLTGVFAQPGYQQALS